MLFDQFSERISFSRFEESITFLAKSQKFDLQKLFIELCGKQKKYITFQRLLDQYQQSNSKQSSLELQNFFSYFMDTVIKVEIFIYFIIESF
jgi:hypothetical protein